ncbi:MAG: basic secretory protein-like protein [Bacteroidota bacterium]
MKKHALLLFAVLFALSASAQLTTTYKRKGYTLNYTNTDVTLDSALQQKMINTFFEVYPKLAKEYNKETDKVVYMILDTTYKGVAATGNAHVRISPKWMHQHPEDIDVITHEVMHIVQNYGRSTGPGWLTEGIADYARNQFGVNNPAAKWSLGEYKPGQNYTNSYRITARFLFWIEKKIKPGIVKELDKQMRDHTFTDAVWASQTTKTLDELWAAYIADPAI